VVGVVRCLNWFTCGDGKGAQGGDRKSSTIVVLDSLPENLPEQKGDARDKAGAAMNVSGKAVDMAAKVHAKAIPEIIDAVDRGELAVSAAAIVADMPAEEQRAIESLGITKNQSSRYCFSLQSCDSGLCVSGPAGLCGSHQHRENGG